MKWFFLAVIALVFSGSPVYSAKNAILFEPAPVSIRVRVAKTLKQVDVRGLDLRISRLKSENGKVGRSVIVASNRRTEWFFQCNGNQIKLNALHLTQYDAITVKGRVAVNTPAGFLSLNGRPYRGEMQIVPSQKDGRCTVVNVLDIEKYLDGLVNSEFSSKWSFESVAAQVVAARTYAIHQIEQAKKNPDRAYDVDASVSDQVYDGFVVEDHHASRAVAKTRGMVLTAGLGKSPIKAFYHSTCGGITARPETVWGSRQPGFKKNIRCRYCRQSPAYRWERVLSQKEIAEALYAGAPKKNRFKGWPEEWMQVIRDGKLTGISILGLDSGRRVRAVVTKWEHNNKKHHLHLSGTQLRNWAGPSVLKSTRFRVAKSSKGWKFHGLGNGHGVGMCQWGAKRMGEQGFKMAGILKHYYPDARLEKIW